VTDARATYDQLPPLSAVYLEDSYVLGVSTDDKSVQFDLDLVLTPEHPAYSEPRPGEQYCYRRAKVTIVSARSVRWIRQTMRPFRDATGEADYGSIDAWSLDGDISHIEGDWGELEVAGGAVRVLLEPDAEETQGGHGEARRPTTEGS